MSYSKITLGVLLALGVQAQAHAADLLDTYHAAQGQDAVFASARAAQQAGKEKLSQGRATMLPSVSLSANSTYYDNQIDYPTSSKSLNYN